jgi:hypothetical protein
LGGYTDIEEIINIINDNLKDNLDDIKDKLKIKYSKFNDNKLILRIIEIFIPILS